MRVVREPERVETGVGAADEWSWESHTEREASRLCRTLHRYQGAGYRRF